MWPSCRRYSDFWGVLSAAGTKPPRRKMHLPPPSLTQVSDPIPVAHPQLKPDVYRVVPNWWRLSLVVPILFARPKRSHIRWKKMFFEVAGKKGLNGCFWCLLFLRDNIWKLYPSISCSLQMFTAQRMVWSCRCWVQFIDARVFLPLTPLNINMDLRFSPVWKVKKSPKKLHSSVPCQFSGLLFRCICLQARTFQPPSPQQATDTVKAEVNAWSLAPSRLKNVPGRCSPPLRRIRRWPAGNRVRESGTGKGNMLKKRCLHLTVCMVIKIDLNMFFLSFRTIPSCCIRIQNYHGHQIFFNYHWELQTLKDNLKISQWTFAIEAGTKKKSNWSKRTS